MNSIKSTLSSTASAINPLSTKDGTPTSTGAVKFFGCKMEHDLGQTANWTIRKSYDSVTGAPGKAWRSLVACFYGKSSDVTAKGSDSETKHNVAANPSNAKQKTTDPFTQEETVDFGVALHELSDYVAPTDRFEDFGAVDESKGADAFAQMDAVGTKATNPTTTSNSTLAAHAKVEDDSDDEVEINFNTPKESLSLSQKAKGRDMAIDSHLKFEAEAVAVKKEANLKKFQASLPSTPATGKSKTTDDLPSGPSSRGSIVRTTEENAALHARFAASKTATRTPNSTTTSTSTVAARNKEEIDRTWRDSEPTPFDLAEDKVTNLQKELDSFTGAGIGRSLIQEKLTTAQAELAALTEKKTI